MHAFLLRSLTASFRLGEGFHFDSNECKSCARSISILQTLEDHVRVYPNTTEFVHFRTESSVLAQLDRIANTHKPPFPRPKIVRSEAGVVAIGNPLADNPVFESVRVFFVGSQITRICARLAKGDQELTSALPLDQFKYAFVSQSIARR